MNLINLKIVMRNKDVSHQVTLIGSGLSMEVIQEVSTAV